MKYYRFNLVVGVWMEDEETLEDAKVEMAKILYDGEEPMNVQDEDLELIEIETDEKDLHRR